jgi:hypothetical protein
VFASESRRFSDHQILPRGDVAARTFEDSAGTVWEVFEVHRASEAPRGVSAGLEKGWLAFVSAAGKRRLAPFPAEWESAPPSELERLCGAARAANPARFSGGQASPPTNESSKRPALPTARLGAAPGGAQMDEFRESLVRDAVRTYAHEARARNLSAIEAMVRMKAMLAERYSGKDVSPATLADANDMRSVRRWFVEAYYFERP